MRVTARRTAYSPHPDIPYCMHVYWTTTVNIVLSLKLPKVTVTA